MVHLIARIDTKFSSRSTAQSFRLCLFAVHLQLDSLLFTKSFSSSISFSSSSNSTWIFAKTLNYLKTKSLCEQVKISILQNGGKLELFMFFIGQNYVQHRVKTFLRLIFELLLKFIQILNIVVNFGSLFSTFVRRLVEFKENL